MKALKYIIPVSLILVFALILACGKSGDPVSTVNGPSILIPESERTVNLISAMDEFSALAKRKKPAEAKYYVDFKVEVLKSDVGQGCAGCPSSLCGFTQP